MIFLTYMHFENDGRTSQLQTLVSSSQSVNRLIIVLTNKNVFFNAKELVAGSVINTQLLGC